MKKILPAIFVLIGTISNAQIINFPDANFKNALLSISPTIDLNHDNQIQVSEASAVTMLLLDSKNIADLTGILYFTNVATLILMDNHLSTLNVSGLTNLSVINCQRNNMTSINLSGATGLTYLDCSRNNLTTLNLTGLTNLSSIYCQENSITGLTLNNFPDLSIIDCHLNSMTVFNISNCPVLNTINCNDNHLTSLDLTNVTALQFVFSDHNQLSNVKLNGLSNLLQAYFRYNQLTSLPLIGLTKLTQISALQNSLTSIDISGCPALNFVEFPNNQLTYMNLKNGPTTLQNFVVMGNTSLHFICIDDAEVTSLQSSILAQGLTGVNINSYCSFTPGGNYNTITGTTRIDTDNNGCTTGDPASAGTMVKMTDGVNTGSTYTNAAGIYTFYVNAGNYTITPQNQNAYFIPGPVSTSLNFPTVNNSVQTANFCLSLNGNHPDVDVVFIPMNAARPGFNTQYQLIYKNKGTTTLSGDVKLYFNDSRLNLVNTIPAATTQQTNLLSWNYSNLLPLQSRTIDIQFNILPPPVNNINDSLIFTSKISPLSGDETPLDNSFIMPQILTGSFDPNDKACLQGSKIDITRVGDYVHYLIRFQNTGTDTAFNVVVKDILTNKLNWNSLEIIKTSHPCILRQSNGNKLEFIFENIKLPATITNEPASHGFVSFKIKTVNTLVIGDQFSNNAYIYFDFNLPVITNTVTSLVAANVVIPVKIEYFKGAIQGNNHILNWKVNCTSLQANLDVERCTDGRNYNSLTSITASNTRCLQPFDFTDNNPAAGINYYRIRMTDIDGKVTYSSVIALLNKKTGFEIVNLLPNPVTGGIAILNITSAVKQGVNIIVSDASGKTVQSLDQQVISGFTQVTMNFSQLAAGVYTIAIYTNDGERKTKQFVKK